jgi:hypothetical protein
MIVGLPTRLRCLATVMLLTVAGACTKADGPTATAPDLTGSWSGTWESCKNGHHGPLHAQFCKTCDGEYEVVFHGRFFKVIPFRYATTLHVTGYESDRVFLTASKRLGPVLGRFEMNAKATATEFTAHWCSGNDHGLFTLKRCSPQP